MAFVVASRTELDKNEQGSTRVWDFRVDAEEHAHRLNVRDNTRFEWAPIEVDNVKELSIVERKFASKKV